MKYSNAKLNTLTFEGNTKADKAWEIWSEMNPMQRVEIMEQVHDFKDLKKRQRACLNFIADNLI